jgi:ubiquinone/menaquinone biosynthesis C-methylase UbiE
MTTKQLQKLEKLLDHVGDIALRRRARRMIRDLDPKPGDKILDVGCGDGFYLFLLSHLGIKLSLYGTDFDPLALKSAKINLKDKKIPLKQADLMKKLPFKDKFFNKVVMSEVAEHLPNDVKGIKEVARVLKPGGILCLTVPNANYPFLWDPVNKILETFSGNHIKEGFWAGLWFNHIRLYTVNQIKQVVEKANLQVEAAEALTFWCLPFNHHIVNMGARVVYAKNTSEKIVQAVSKYEVDKPLSPSVKAIFGIFRLVDRLNDLYQPKKHGAGVYVKAVKN